MHPPCCRQPSAVWAMERAQALQSCPTWGRHPARLALTLALAATPTMVAVGSGFGFDCKTMATSGGREGTARGRVQLCPATADRDRIRSAGPVPALAWREAVGRSGPGPGEDASRHVGLGCGVHF